MNFKAMNRIKTFSLLVVLSVCSMAVMAQKSIVTGKITGFAGEKVAEIQFFYDAKTQKVAVDKEQHTFQAELDLKEAQFLEIKSGGSFSSFLYVVPGENFELNIDKATLNDATIVPSDGKIKTLNAGMNQFYKFVEENGFKTTIKDWGKELFNRPELVSRAIEKAVAENASNEKLISTLAPQFKKDFNLFAEAVKKYILIDKLTLSEIEILLEGISHSEMKNTVLTIPLYREYLIDLTNSLAARKLENWDLILDYQKSSYIAQSIASEACVKYFPNKSVINYLFYDKISRELTVSGVKHQKYIDYLFANSSKIITDNFTKQYETLKANSSGVTEKERVAAKDFEFHDVNGKAYHLADFKGKLLLLDFWASWCAPCKAQIPHMKELEKIYAGKDIVFASISLDASKEAWLKGVKDEELHNLVLHAEKNFKNAFPVAYGINSIPRFMLIDAEGKIISDNMSKPQNKKEVMAMIDADLYKAQLGQILDKHMKAVGAENLMHGNGLEIKSLQSFMGIEIVHESQYSYPKNLRFNFRPKENAALLPAVGEDFFKNRYLVVNKDTAVGNVKDLEKAASSWIGKLAGLEIFLANKVENVSFDFAEENSDNPDNQYVLKGTFNNRTDKYYLDKGSFLIKKIVSIGKIDPRMGGGFIEAVSKYENYKSVNGVMIPHSTNLNNIITIKVMEATVKPIDKKVFSISEK